MRIVIVSDTHCHANLEQVVLQQPTASYFIHLGDGADELDDVRRLSPNAQFLSVRGNCDFASHLPVENELNVCGKLIFYTHGHRYDVKYGLSRIVDEAKKRKADILLFGHTHHAFTSYDKGLYIMNPGSLGLPRDGPPSYGVIDITPAGIVLNVVNV